MKSLNLLVLAAALFIALPASAQQVKPYHQNIKDCAACHTKENAVAGNQFVTPDNKACLTCHQSYAAVCTACHSEHKTSQVYCNNCHEFKYQIK